MSAHEHAFNATPISCKANGLLRCACGAWTTVRRLDEGRGPLSDGFARGLETRLANERLGVTREWADDAPELDDEDDEDDEDDRVDVYDYVTRKRRSP